MKRVFQSSLIAAAAITLAISSLTANAEVHYRWTDDRGNPVHSDRPPPKGTPYEVVSTNSSLVRRVDPDEGAVPAATEPTAGNEFEQTDTNPKAVQKNAEQCKRARDNLETLNTKSRIQIRDDKGELRALSEKEKAEQREQATATISAHCD